MQKTKAQSHKTLAGTNKKQKTTKSHHLLRILDPHGLFPTCQVRVVRFYVSCLVLLLLLSSPPPLVVLLLSLSSSSSCSTATRDPQCSLSDLNREYPRQVFPAGPHVGRYGPQPGTCPAQCAPLDLNGQIECQKICQIECQIE